MRVSKQSTTISLVALVIVVICGAYAVTGFTFATMSSSDGYYLSGGEGMNIETEQVEIDRYNFRDTGTLGGRGWSDVEIEDAGTNYSKAVFDGEDKWYDVVGGSGDDFYNDGKGLYQAEMADIKTTTGFDIQLVSADGKHDSPQSCHLKGAMTQPEIDRDLFVNSGGKQDIDNPWKVHQLGEWKEDGDTHVLTVDEYILKNNVDIATHTGSEYNRGSGYKASTVWLKISPQEWDYVEPVNDNWESVTDKPDFGLKQVVLAKTDYYGTEDYDGAESPLLGHLQGEETLPIYSEPSKDADEFESSDASDIVTINGEDYQTNNKIFADSWYVPIKVDSMGVDEDPNTISKNLFQQEIQGQLSSVELEIHVYTLGEWRIDSEIVADYESMKKESVTDEGTVSNIGQALQSFFSGPLGISTIVIAILVLLAIVGFMFMPVIMMMGGSSG